jgi:hypothetical protein
LPFEKEPGFNPAIHLFTLQPITTTRWQNSAGAFLVPQKSQPRGGCGWEYDKGAIQETVYTFTSAV